nr:MULTISPECIES: hypothetical protein [unclassified Mesorhizobium]
MAVVAERAFTSRSTLQRVEAGDTNVSIGIYAGVLQSARLLDGLTQLPDIGNDEVSPAPATSTAWPAPSSMVISNGRWRSKPCPSTPASS